MIYFIYLECQVVCGLAVEWAGYLGHGGVSYRIRLVVYSPQLELVIPEFGGYEDA
jgi:hypothetical protein